MPNDDKPQTLNFNGHEIPRGSEMRHGLVVWEMKVPVPPGMHWKVQVDFVPAEMCHESNVDLWLFLVEFCNDNSQGSIADARETEPTWELVQEKMAARLREMKVAANVLLNPPEINRNYIERGLRYIISTSLGSGGGTASLASAAYAAVMLEKLGFKVSDTLKQALQPRDGTGYNYFSEAEDQMGHWSGSRGGLDIS